MIIEFPWSEHHRRMRRLRRIGTRILVTLLQGHREELQQQIDLGYPEVLLLAERQRIAEIETVLNERGITP